MELDVITQTHATHFVSSNRAHVQFDRRCYLHLHMQEERCFRLETGVCKAGEHVESEEHVTTVLVLPQ